MADVLGDGSDFSSYSDQGREGGSYAYQGNNPSSNWDWGSIAKGGFQGLMGAVPGMLGAAAGYGFNSLMPGKTTLTDTRNPQQKQLAQSGMSSLSALQANPNSFGLPGDPEDVNSQAGRKLYGIRQQARGADAARGMFTTGGSAQRENNAVTDASSAAFNQLNQTYGQQAAQGPGMTLQSKPNPWAQLFSGIASPAVSGIASGILQKFGLSG